MSQQTLNPGPAAGAHIEREGEKWTLVLVRELRHPREKVWRALTETENLHQWAPFEASRNLDSTGPVTLQTVSAPQDKSAQCEVTRAEAPAVLEYNWGGNTLRWELEEAPVGTKLILWHNIDKNFIAMGAAGWHVCLAVLDHMLAGEPVGRIVGQDALKYGDWQRLHKEYAEQFGPKENQ